MRVVRKLSSCQKSNGQAEHWVLVAPTSMTTIVGLCLLLRKKIFIAGCK